MAELATDALCRSLTLLDGELPAGLPQDVIDNVVRSLIQHSALNATTLRILSQCQLGELSLAGCRGVTDQWLAPFQATAAPMYIPLAQPLDGGTSDESMQEVDHGHDDDDDEEEDQAFFSSLETKHSSDNSSCSSETFCSATASVTPSTSWGSTVNLTILDLRGSQRLTDSGLAQLAQLHSLQVARLDHCHSIQGPGLAALAHAHELHTVSLDNCRRLTDEAVWQLAHLISLENLSLSGCRCLTDSALQALADLYNLRKLDLSQCDLISDQGLAHLENLQVLEELSLGWCRSISDEGVKLLAEQTGKARHLRTLRLARCNLTDQCLPYLSRLQALEELDLNGCHLLSSMATGKALAQLTHLSVLDISYCPSIL